MIIESCLKTAPKCSWRWPHLFQSTFARIRYITKLTWPIIHSWCSCCYYLCLSVFMIGWVSEYENISEYALFRIILWAGRDISCDACSALDPCFMFERWPSHLSLGQLLLKSAITLSALSYYFLCLSLLDFCPSVGRSPTFSWSNFARVCDNPVSWPCYYIMLLDFCLDFCRALCLNSKLLLESLCIALMTLRAVPYYFYMLLYIYRLCFV